MQFRVPQFIDIEDKVIGPLTLKQFGYVLGAAGFSFLIWTFIPIKIIAVILMVLVSALFLALAFLKINKRSFGEILENAFAFYTGNRIYTWKQPEEPKSTLGNADGIPNIQKVVAEAKKDITIARVSRDRLHDLSLGLDVLDRNPQQEENEVK